MGYCDECKHLSPKEREQADKGEPHFCDAYDKPLFHNNQHPRIPTPDYCITNKVREYEIYKDMTAKLDELADLSEYWKKHRSLGRIPSGIKMAMITIANEITDKDNAPP